MSSKSEFERENPDEVTIEQSLVALTPRAPHVDRDRLMFLAGRAAARCQESVVRGQEKLVIANRGGWLWPATTAVLGATSLVLAIALGVQSAAPPQIVYVERPAPAVPAKSPQVVVQTNQTPAVPIAADNTADRPRLAPQAVAAPSVPADNYLRSRDVALRMGLDALGSPRSIGSGPNQPMTYLDWLVGFDGPPAPSQPGDPPDSSLPRM